MMENNDFDELLEETIEEIVCEEFLAIEDYIGEHGAHIFSDDFENKMEKLIHKENIVYNNNSERLHRVRGPKIRYLLVAILLLLMGALTAFTYKPVRVVLENFVYSIFQDYLLIEEEKNIELDKNISKEIEWKYPKYIPEGYKEIVNHFDEVGKELYLIYENEDKKILSYTQYTVNTRSTVTSDGTSIENIKIGDIDATITYDKNGTIVVFFEENGSFFEISGEVEKDKMIKIVENIE